MKAKGWMQTLKWDHHNRLRCFWTRYFGSDPESDTPMLGTNFWVSMVRRVYEPGCQMDKSVVIDGSQGGGKSMALSLIGGQWYAEATSFSGKDAEGWKDKILIEIPEFAQFSSKSVEKMKAFIAAREDTYRPLYARKIVTTKRQFVFVGTTNFTPGYMRGIPTGQRRWFPVKIESPQLMALLRDRQQLFAEAVHLYKMGWRWVGL